MNYSITNHIYDVRLTVNITENTHEVAVNVKFGGSNRIVFCRNMTEAQAFAQALVADYAVSGYYGLLSNTMKD